MSNPTLALRWGADYNVKVDVSYALSNSAGVQEPVIVIDGAASTENCLAVTIQNHPLVEVKSTQRCPASLLRSNYLIGDRVGVTTPVCGAINYSYEFTQVASCTDGTAVSLFPSVYTTTSASPYLPLGVLASLPNTGTWDVRIRPNFAYGAGTFGPSQRIKVTGTSASATLPNEEPLTEERSMMEDALTSHVYPNPNNGHSAFISYSGLENEQVEVRVLDATGRVLQTQVIAVDGDLNRNLEFRTPLAAGLYFIEMRDGDKSVQDRMIVE